MTHCGVQGFIAYLSIRLNRLKCWQNWVVRNCLLHRDSLNFWRLLKIESACCLRLESELLLILRFLEGGSLHIFLAWIILRSKRYDIFILRREEGLSVEGICLREFNWWAWLLILNWRSNLAEGFLGGTAVSRNAWLLICGIHQLILSWVISGIHLLHLIKLFLYFWAPALDFVLVNYLVYLILIRLGLGRRFKFLILFFCVQSLQGMLLESFHIKIWGLFHDGLHLTRYRMLCWTKLVPMIQIWWDHGDLGTLFFLLLFLLCLDLPNLKVARVKVLVLEFDLGAAKLLICFSLQPKFLLGDFARNILKLRIWQVIF